MRTPQETIHLAQVMQLIDGELVQVLDLGCDISGPIKWTGGGAAWSWESGFLHACLELGYEEAVQLPSVLLAPLPGNCLPRSALCSRGGGIPPWPTRQDKEPCPRQGCST